MSVLFINPIGTDIRIFSVDDSNLHLITSLTKGDDFSTFPDEVVRCVEERTIDEIWCLCGPGAFTRMRIVTLTLNTLKLTKSLTLKGVHFFDIIPDGFLGALRANDREYIIESPSGEIDLIETENIPAGKYAGYGEKNDFTNREDFIQYTENLEDIKRVFEKTASAEGLSPIYYKDPHITWSKKNTSDS